MGVVGRRGVEWESWVEDLHGSERSNGSVVKCGSVSVRGKVSDGEKNCLPKKIH